MARFGVTIYFGAPDKKEFQNIVRNLAARAGVDMDEETYNAYVEEVISRSDVDTGIRPVYGEQLLTLSTCEYSSDNGRYVVVARRVDS